MIFAKVLIETKFLNKFIKNLSDNLNSPRLIMFFSSLGLGVLPIHGRTLFTLSATDNKKVRDGFRPLNDFVFA